MVCRNSRFLMGDSSWQGRMPAENLPFSCRLYLSPSTAIYVPIDLIPLVDANGISSIMYLVERHQPRLLATNVVPPTSPWSSSGATPIIHPLPMNCASV